MPNDWSSKNPALRAIVGALNKISDRNYATICTRITDVLSSGAATATEVCRAVIVKCYQEDGYLPLYVRLLLDMQRSLSESGRPEACEQMLEQLDEFVTAFVNVDVPTELGCAEAAKEDEEAAKEEEEEEEEEQEEQEERNVKEGERRKEVQGGGKEGGGHGKAAAAASKPTYDDFCAASKRKRYAIGKNRTVIAFMRSAVVGHPKANEYFEGLIALLGRQKTDEHIELALDFIMDYVRAFPQLSRGNMATMRSVFDNAIVPTCSPRSRFKILDVYGACKCPARA